MITICNSVQEEEQCQIEKKSSLRKNEVKYIYIYIYIYVNAKMLSPFPKRLDLMVPHLDLLLELDNEDHRSTPLKQSGSHPSYFYWIWEYRTSALRPRTET